MIMNDDNLEDCDMKSTSINKSFPIVNILACQSDISIDNRNLDTSPIGLSNDLYNEYPCNHVNSFTQGDNPFSRKLGLAEIDSNVLKKRESRSPILSPISVRPTDAACGAESPERPVTPDNVTTDEIPYEYINPFTPDGKIITNKVNALKRIKRLSISSTPLKCNLNDSSGSDITESKMDTEIDLVPNRPRLSQFNVSRFIEEFIILKEIGKGVHGCVYKCLNRMNGCVYAVKRTLNPIQSDFQERVVRNEIYAHGVLNHQNIVRNYSCWKEDGFVFIQNEYCSGGSLEDYIKTNVLSETTLRKLLLQMAEALRYIHKKELAHMDVKPGNIFITIDKDRKSCVESCGGTSESEKTNEIISFKLGDLGHIISLDEELHDIEEGDCRYLAREIVEGHMKYLDKADIFALGLTVYEASGGGPLPKNGEEWQEIRDGKLLYLKEYSKDFFDILTSMIHPSPEKRPSASGVIQMLKPNNNSPDNVCQYIQHYRLNNTHLEQRYEATGQYLRTLFQSHKVLQEQLHCGKKVFGTYGKETFLSAEKKKGSVTKTRVVGRKTQRSNSTLF